VRIQAGTDGVAVFAGEEVRADLVQVYVRVKEGLIWSCGECTVRPISDGNTRVVAGCVVLFPRDGTTSGVQFFRDGSVGSGTCRTCRTCRT